MEKLVYPVWKDRELTSDHAFYDTGGDDAVLQQRMTAMMASCARFIDFEKIDVIAMSEYVIKPL